MRRLLSVCAAVAAAGLLVTGCGGSSSPSRPAAQSSAADASASASADARQPTSGAPAPAGSSSATGSPAQPGPSQSSRQQQATTQQQAQQGTQSQTQALPPLTRPGRYTYTATGTSKSPFGNKDIDGTATLTVDPPSGHQQHQSLSSPDISQDQTLLAQAGGYYLVQLKISAQGFSEEFHADPPVLFAPAAFTAGKAWSWQLTSTDGKYTVHTDSQMVRREQQKTTRGTAVDTVLIHSVVKVSGSGISFTSTQDDWFSPAYALIVKEHSVMHGTGYGQTFDSDVTRTLESTSPS